VPFQLGTYRTHAEPVDLAVTFASLLGINAPTHAVGRVLTEAVALAHHAENTSPPAGRSPKTTRPSNELKPAALVAMKDTEMTPAVPTRGAPDLSVNLAGLPLKNPVIAASGTFGYGLEFEDIVHLDRLGGFVVKGLSREPMTGNPPPRLYETTAAAYAQCRGLQNIGARAFVDEKLPKLREIKNIVRLRERLWLHSRRL